MGRLTVLLLVASALLATPAQAHYLRIDRAQRAAVHGAKYFRGSDRDRVAVDRCRHGQPSSKIVYCHVTETGPAIEALDWSTMDYVIAVVLSSHRPQLVVNGGYSVNWYEPFRRY
jgi:hypothetical protein